MSMLTWARKCQHMRTVFWKNDISNFCVTVVLAGKNAHHQHIRAGLYNATEHSHFLQATHPICYILSNQRSPTIVMATICSAVALASQSQQRPQPFSPTPWDDFFLSHRPCAPSLVLKWRWLHYSRLPLVSLISYYHNNLCSLVPN